MKVSEKLYSIYFKKNIPLFASIEITRRCVNNCVHCYLNETHGNNSILKDEMSLYEIKKVFLELKDIKTIFLNITGGEPILRKDIYEIISLAVELGFCVKLFSSLNFDSNKIDMLYESGVRDIDVSLYGRREIHNKITKRDCFDLTVYNMKKAKKMGFKINVKTPIMKINIKEIDWIKKFSSKNSFNFKIDPIITPRNDGDLAPLELSSTNLKFLRLFKDYFKNGNRNLTQNGKYMSCGAMRSVIAIDCYGNLLPCLAFPCPVGSVKNNKIIDILKSDAAKYIRKKLEIEPLKCIKCNYKAICSRCAGISWLYAKDESYVYKQACDVSKNIAKFF